MLNFVLIIFAAWLVLVFLWGVLDLIFIVAAEIFETPTHYRERQRQIALMHEKFLQENPRLPPGRPLDSTYNSYDLEAAVQKELRRAKAAKKEAQAKKIARNGPWQRAVDKFVIGSMAAPPALLFAALIWTKLTH
jgi:hypothetical protein